MFRKQNKPSSSKNSQLGIFAMPDMEEGEDSDGSDGDLDLEAELAAISGNNYKPRPRKRPTPAAPDLDTMIAASLRDDPSDEDVNSGDENDPELLSELKELGLEDEAPPSAAPRSARPAPPPPTGAGGIVGLLQERITNYTQAEKNAKTNGENARARRFGRGLKTLNDLLRQAKAGKAINEDDIPPAVSTGKQAPSAPPTDNTSAPVPSSPELDTPEQPALVPPEPQEALIVEETAKEPPPLPSGPSPSSPPPMDEEREKGLRFIMKRREEFKSAALAAKHAGDKATALEHLKMVKNFDLVVEAYKNGEPMDLSELPTPESLAVASREPQKEENTVEQSSNVAPSDVMEEESSPAGLVTASTVEEALKQRLEVFKEQVAKAKEQGNSSKMRRMGRIVKQYEDAIKQHSAGRPIAVEELPTPPGYAPIPAAASPQQRPAPEPSPRPAARQAPAPRPAPAAPASPAASIANTRAGKQLAFLLNRQKEFKEAALNAKKEGDIGLAKEYLRNAKGFDSVIEAARGGLAVDLNSLPLPPQAKQQLEDTFDLITAEDCDPGETGGGDVLSRLHEQLNTQLKLCLATRDHNKAMGNVAETNRFEHLANGVKQDLDVVTLAKRNGSDIPKFHYEMRQFAVIQCNTDLNDNDLELTIVRGITYNVPNPKDVDTYVKFEFPYPQETPVSDRTALVKDTNSPEYNALFPLSITRSSRACLRVFKRQSIKLEVYSRGGFFSRDSLLGTALVKLQPLETHTTIHEAFPLMEGRRPAGGSIEAKVRIRHPLLGKQIDHSSHKWLVIDHQA